MRLDQFLNKSGIIKRRSLAKELCDKGAVDLNGRVAKASNEVKSGDKLAVKSPERRSHYLIREIPTGNVRKEDRGKYAELTSEENFHSA
ncbi:MAG: RNA-binding S4 domain-containing protein [bacterium]|nr:RNA-binding S4 domain-containing protein [bacterium]